MGPRSISAITIFVALVLTLTFVWFQIGQTPAADQALMKDIFYLFAGTFVPDRGMQVVSEIATELAAAKASDQIKLLADHKSGFRQFTGHEAAVRYAISNAAASTLIWNTVLHSDSARAKRSGPLYAAWLKQKLESIESGRCAWVEIVSSHLPETHVQLKTMSKLQRLGEDRYVARLIDDKSTPMPSITVFTLEDGRKEMILGWDSGGGACFLVTDEALIAYFEACFDRHLRAATIEWAKPAKRRLF